MPNQSLETKHSFSHPGGLTSEGADPLMKSSCMWAIHEQYAETSEHIQCGAWSGEVQSTHLFHQMSLTELEIILECQQCQTRTTKRNRHTKMYWMQDIRNTRNCLWGTEIQGMPWLERYSRNDSGGEELTLVHTQVEDEYDTYGRISSQARNVSGLRSKVSAVPGHCPILNSQTSSVYLTAHTHSRGPLLADVLFLGCCDNSTPEESGRELWGLKKA